MGEDAGVARTRDRRKIEQVTRLLIAATIALIAWCGLPRALAAHGSAEEPVFHSLTIVLAYPDTGLAADEQICLALFAGDDADLASPLEITCINAEANAATFGALAHGQYKVAVPAPGSSIFDDRYQGQVVETEIPDLPEVDSFVIDVPLNLTGAATGTVGLVQVGAYVCPPGTDRGSDLEGWLNACQGRVDGVGYTLTSAGSLTTDEMSAMTGSDGLALFPDLPAGTFSLTETALDNVEEQSAWFASSSLDGTTSTIAPGVPFQVRPAELMTIDVFHILLPPTSAPTASVPAPPAAEPSPSVATPGIAQSAPSTTPPALIGLETAPVVSTGGDVLAAAERPPSGRGFTPYVTVLPATGSPAMRLAPNGNNSRSWLGLVAALASIVSVGAMLTQRRRICAAIRARH